MRLLGIATRGNAKAGEVTPEGAAEGPSRVAIAGTVGSLVLGVNSEDGFLSTETNPTVTYEERVVPFLAPFRAVDR